MVVSFYNLIDRLARRQPHFGKVFNVCDQKIWDPRQESFMAPYLPIILSALLGVVTASPSFAVIEGINLNTTCIQACERDRELVSPERAAATHATGSSWVAGLVWSPTVALSSMCCFFSTRTSFKTASRTLFTSTYKIYSFTLQRLDLRKTVEVKPVKTLTNEL